jgi:hypothetical protein
MPANIVDDFPLSRTEKVIQALVRATDVPIERIISHGHASPADF